jgi:hypothetical protein
VFDAKCQFNLFISLRGVAGRGFGLPRFAVVAQSNLGDVEYGKRGYIFEEYCVIKNALVSREVQEILSLSKNCCIKAIMHFTLTTLVLTLALSSICSTQETCPAIPETGVTIGDPVPIKPEDIPRGCSPYEILVGQ